MTITTPRLTKAAIAAAAIGLITAAQADAAVAYMDGVLNVGPGWSTITAPDGQRCGTGCTEVRYDYLTQGSATRAAGAWMDANNTPDSVLFVYSLGSVGAVTARSARPDWQGTIIALGSPAKPNNGASQADGGRPVLDVRGGKVTFVTVKGDSVAERTGSLSTHVNGYRNRNFQTERPVSSTTPAPNVVDNVYPTKPATTTAAPVRFNLFDARTWFRPKAAPVAASATLADEPAPARMTAAERRAARREAAQELRSEHARGDGERKTEAENDAPRSNGSADERAENDAAAADATGPAEAAAPDNEAGS